MKTITTPTGIELLIVPVPEESKEYKISREHLFFNRADGWGKWGRNIDTQHLFNEGFDYKILGSVTKDTIDFDCSQLVEKSKWVDFVGWKHYNPPPEDIIRLKTNSADSFRSLLQSNGVTFENHLSDKLRVPEGFPGAGAIDLRSESNKSEWEAAQKNVVKKVAVIQKLK